ncbi:LuxR C-terminal-related transcriptional regulator [Myroides sp. LJL119]
MILFLLTKRKSIFAILFVFIQISHAQSEGNLKSQKQIESLNFYKINPHKDVLFATDSLGHQWVKGEIPNHLLNSSSIFHLTTGHIYQYDFYLYTQGVLHKIEPNLNIENDFMQSRFVHHYISSDTNVFYVNLYYNLNNNFGFIITEQNKYASFESQELLYIGIYYGITFVLILVNFILFSIFRYNHFLFFTALQICIFINLFFQDGMFYYLSKGAWQMSSLLVWIIPLISALGCVLVMYLLDIEILFKSHKGLFYSLFGINFIFSFLHSLAPDILTMGSVMLLSCISPIFCLLLTLLQFRSDIYARLLLIGICILILFGGIYILQIMNLHFFDFPVIHVFKIVYFCQIVLFTFVISHKVKKLPSKTIYYPKQIQRFLKKISRKKQTNPQMSITLQLQAFGAINNLTIRELEVLICIWEGMSNIQISDKLSISVHTVKYHISNLYTKLQITSRRQALFLRKLNKLI